MSHPFLQAQPEDEEEPPVDERPVPPREAALNEPGSLPELIRHHEGTQTLYQPADGSGRPLCAAHAVSSEGWQRIMHDFARQVGLAHGEQPERPSMRAVGQGRCMDCAHQQNVQRQFAPKPDQFDSNRNRPGSAYHPEPDRWGDRRELGGFTPLPPSLNARRTAAEDYWGAHRPGAPSDEQDGTAAPAHDLTRVYPDDVYDHPHYYGGGEGLHGGQQAFKETVRTLRSIRGNPEADVAIYRSLPKEHAAGGFRTGDWVSIHPKYAEGHGLHPTDPSQDWPVIKATVKAKHLWNNGDSLDEFGYHGPPIPPDGFHKRAGQERYPSHDFTVSYEGPHAILRAFEPGTDNIRGAVLYRHHDAGSHYGTDEPLIEIEQIHTEPAHRRRGVATALMREMERRHPGKLLLHERSPEGQQWARSYYGNDEYEDLTRDGRSIMHTAAVDDGGLARYRRMGYDYHWFDERHVERGDRFTWMHPDDVVSHASPRDGEFQSTVDHLAESLTQHGWKPQKGQRWMTREHGYGNLETRPVTLWHTDNGSFVEPGNHRAWAAQKAGLDRMPVLVRDRRTGVDTPPETGDTHVHAARDGETARHQERGRAPELGARTGGSRRNRPQPVEADPGRDDAPQALRYSLVEHPKLAGDLKRLPPKVRAAYDDRVDLLRAGGSHPSTHALNGKLKGWLGTSLTGPHRMVHRYDGDDLLVLSAGNHDEAYDQGIRRDAGKAGPDYHLDDAARVSVAEQVMERAGHSGRTFTVPNNRGDWDADRRHPAAHYLHEALIGHGHPEEDARRIRVYPDSWNLRDGGFATTDGLNTVGTRPEVNELTLLHEAAHILTRTPEGPSGHGQRFQQAAHDLYHRHLGPQAAQVFRNVLESSGSQKLASTRLVRPSDVWDHVRIDLRPHRVQHLVESITEHGYQPGWDHADGPIKVDLSGDTPRIGNGSHRLHVLKQLGLDDPIPMHVTGAWAVDQGDHWHVSHTRNRESIEEHGLLPGDRGRIWLYNDEQAAREHQSLFGDSDLYRVNVNGYRTAQDPDLVGQSDHPLRRTVRKPIPPDRIQRVGALAVREYEGTPGNRDHITRSETGLIPVAAIAHLHGARGERPGEHRNRHGQDWEDFKADVAANGIKSPLFVTVDPYDEPKLAEGNHRRDAAVELGLTHVPVEVRYFGHAERQGTVEERARRLSKDAAIHPYAQQDWYHAGDLRHPSLRGPLHVGTQQAALRRIDPDQWDLDEFPHIRHARLYRVRLSPGARVCPTVHDDDDDAGSLGFHGHGEYDVHPYRNAYEDKGSISLVGRAGAFQVVEDLGRHPKWGQQHEAKFDQRIRWRISALDNEPEEEPEEEIESGVLRPEDYHKLTFGDYPGKRVHYVHQALTHREPQYMAALEADIRRNGVQHPVEIAHHDEDQWEVVGGHHRLATAWHLGIPVPYVRTQEAGDYEPPDVYHEDNSQWRERRKQHPEEYQAYMRRGEADDPFRGKWAKLDLHQVRVLNPTTGFDPDLFDGDRLKPAVRQELLQRWTAFCARHGLRDWSSWGRIFFTGGEASLWSGPGSNPNSDFDTQISINFPKFREANPSWPSDPQAICDRLNQLFWDELNDHHFTPGVDHAEAAVV